MPQKYFCAIEIIHTWEAEDDYYPDYSQSHTVICLETVTEAVCKAIADLRERDLLSYGRKRFIQVQCLDMTGQRLPRIERLIACEIERTVQEIIAYANLLREGSKELLQSRADCYRWYEQYLADKANGSVVDDHSDDDYDDYCESGSGPAIDESHWEWQQHQEFDWEAFQKMFFEKVVPGQIMVVEYGKSFHYCKVIKQLSDIAWQVELSQLYAVPTFRNGYVAKMRYEQIAGNWRVI
jgi:hypothetical protein